MIINKKRFDMKFNVKWFSITLMLVVSVPALALFIWCSATGFGADIVKLFESIHPSGGFSIIKQLTQSKGFSSCIPGIVINFFYTVVDTFIVGFVFASVYNTFVSKFAK